MATLLVAAVCLAVPPRSSGPSTLGVVEAHPYAWIMTSFGLETLSAEECETLLANHAFGRVAVWSGDHPAVLPVLYRLLDGDVVFRTAPGEKLIAAVLGQQSCSRSTPSNRRAGPVGA
jgi:hypothetical protein